MYQVQVRILHNGYPVATRLGDPVDVAAYTSLALGFQALQEKSQATAAAAVTDAALAAGVDLSQADTGHPQEPDAGRERVADPGVIDRPEPA